MIEYDEKTARATERSYLSPEIVRQRLRTLAVLALRAGEHVLNVGCGPGLLAHDMALQVGTPRTAKHVFCHTALAYKRPFAEPKGCISERQQPAISGRSRCSIGRSAYLEGSSRSDLSSPRAWSSNALPITRLLETRA